MAKTVTGLLLHCKQAVKNNVKYVYGAKMQVLTKAQIKALQNTYGKKCVWDSDLNKAGQLCCDCSGLISSYTSVVRGSTNYKDTALSSVSISELNKNWSKYIGWGLWMQGHIGVVSATKGYYYAMDGSARNMVHYPMAKQGWTKCIKLCDIDYSVQLSQSNSSSVNTNTNTKKEDTLVVSGGKAIVNGKEYKIDKILKDGNNYIKASNFSNMGFDVDYDKNTKVVKIKNKTGKVKVNDVEISTINIGGSNYVNLREIAKLVGKSVDFKDGKIVLN